MLDKIKTLVQKQPDMLLICDIKYKTKVEHELDIQNINYTVIIRHRDTDKGNGLNILYTSALMNYYGYVDCFKLVCKISGNRYRFLKSANCFLNMPPNGPMKFNNSKLEKLKRLQSC